MPWFEMIRLPAAYVGGELCWRGEVMWEGAGEHFRAVARRRLPHDRARRCRPPRCRHRHQARTRSAMRLTPPWPVWWLQLASGALVLAAAFGLIVTLVRVEARRTILPFVLIGLAVVGHRRRRRQLPRRRTAVRRRRRWAVLRRCRPAHSAEAAGRRYLGRARRRREGLLLRRPRPALFPRARTHRVRRQLSRLSLARSAVAVPGLAAVPPLPAGALAARADFAVRRDPARHAVRHQLRATTSNGRRAALPIRRPISCSSPAWSPIVGANARRPRRKILPRRCSARCCWRSASP